jgi:NitT/TauT family transport system substrate-binding protein
MTTSWKWVAGGVILTAGVVGAVAMNGRAPSTPTPGAKATTTIRFAYVKVLDELPFFVAEKEGYFKEEGLAIEHIVLNNGPAVVAALSSQSADIGFSATVPLMMARQANLPLQAFAAMDWENPPTEITNTLLTRDDSKIREAKDLSGKTLAINTTAGQCELLARIQLRKAGVPYESVKIVSIPFPQMAAALQLGTVDAVCTVDPFRTAIMQSPAKGRIIGAGMLTEDAPKVRYANTILYAQTPWLSLHHKEVKALVHALDRAAAKIKAEPARARQVLAEVMTLSPAVADAVHIGLGDTVSVRPENLQPVVDSAFTTGMLTTKLDAKDFTFVVE